MVDSQKMRRPWLGRPAVAHGVACVHGKIDKGEFQLIGAHVATPRVHPEPIALVRSTPRLP